MYSVYFGGMTVTNIDAASRLTRLKEIAISCLKLGSIGFGGIAGMVSTIENEMVIISSFFFYFILPAQNVVVCP